MRKLAASRRLSGSVDDNEKELQLFTLKIGKRSFSTSIWNEDCAWGCDSSRGCRLEFKLELEGFSHEFFHSLYANKNFFLNPQWLTENKALISVSSKYGNTPSSIPWPENNHHKFNKNSRSY